MLLSGLVHYKHTLATTRDTLANTLSCIYILKGTGIVVKWLGAGGGGGGVVG